MNNEIGLTYRDPNQPQPGIYDVVSWKHAKKHVAAFGTIEEIRAWAYDVGYLLIGDETEYQINTPNGETDYLALPQHEDYHDEWPRDEAVEVARWM